jgi:hypothetical protein
MTILSFSYSANASSMRLVLFYMRGYHISIVCRAMLYLVHFVHLALFADGFFLWN